MKNEEHDQEIGEGEGGSAILISYLGINKHSLK